MALVVVPGAQPYYVLWCCRDPAQGAWFDLVALPVVDGVPVVETTDQVLTVFLASEAAGSLLLCFLV